MEIREIKTSDAEKFIQLTYQVEKNSKYMLWEAGERKIDSDKQLKIIDSFLQKENSTIFVVENEKANLIGFLMAIGGNAKRNKHSIYIVIGILEEYRGQGVGRKLYDRLDQWAIQHKIRRIELTVVAKNAAGLSLYRKMDFEIEGTKRDSLMIDGEFVDEYYMAKLLEI
ncbi:GNAT family N-acetyltransferase [Virgibacillus siamensis]|uniref:GNAT family N-acetyltransferase n=1 Tax=Virgibacillus siamensis TaxID=480071 RepID=UPI0009863C23|nr:GNAT family N-acetyltransferase [Virgibacillus siamensis]